MVGATMRSRRSRAMIYRLATVLALVSGLSAGAQELVQPFDAQAIGRPPDGFAFAEARGAAAGRWTVEREGSQTVLAHAAAAPDAGGSALAIVADAGFETFEASARIRLVSGQRAGGLVWRYEDPQNYHFVELDLAGQRLDAYRVVRGNHVRFESEDDLELDPDAWYALKVVQDRNRLRVYLGGIRVLDDRTRVDAARGAVGLWSASGSTSWFDDLEVRIRSNRRNENSGR